MSDGDPKQARNEARADAASAKARAKAMRPWYRKKRFILPLILIVIIGIAAAAGSGGDDDDKGTSNVASSDGSHPAEADVTIDACEADQYGYMTAKVTVLNHSSKRSNYIASINFEAPDGTKLGEGTVVTNNIDPDQTAKEETNSAQKAVEGFTCQVEDVTRLSAEG